MPKSSQSKQVLHFIKLHQGHLENLTWLGLPGLIEVLPFFYPPIYFKRYELNNFVYVVYWHVIASLV